MQLDADAILFDIDGTLVDSTPAVERSWRAWAARRALDAEAILRICHGRRSEDTIRTLVPADDVAAAVREIEALELADLGDVIALPGTAALLARLPAARWAAVTSGPRSLMRARLAAAGLPVPEVLISAEDVRDGKPDPEGYRLAASALGFEPKRCLVVEDAPAGIAAGRAAGGAVLAVTTSHPAAELGAADAVIADLEACRVEPTGGRLLVTVGADRSAP